VQFIDDEGEIGVREGGNKERNQGNFRGSWSKEDEAHVGSDRGGLGVRTQLPRLTLFFSLSVMINAPSRQIGVCPRDYFTPLEQELARNSTFPPFSFVLSVFLPRDLSQDLHVPRRPRFLAASPPQTKVG
jgi:hypothetical protein